MAVGRQTSRLSTGEAAAAAAVGVDGTSGSKSKIRQAGTGTVRHVMRENKNGRLFGVSVCPSLCLFVVNGFSTAVNVSVCAVQLANFRDQIEEDGEKGKRLRNAKDSLTHTQIVNCSKLLQFGAAS